MMASSQGHKEIAALLLSGSVGTDSNGPYVPIYGPGHKLAGIWVREPDHQNLGTRLEMFTVGEGLPVEVFAALSSGDYRRVANDRAEIGNGVVLLGGAFLMLGDAKAPSEAGAQRRSPSANSSPRKKWWQFWK